MDVKLLDSNLSQATVLNSWTFILDFMGALQSIFTVTQTFSCTWAPSNLSVRRCVSR